MRNKTLYESASLAYDIESAVAERSAILPRKSLVESAASDQLSTYAPQEFNGEPVNGRCRDEHIEIIEWRQDSCDVFTTIVVPSSLHRY